MAKKSDFASKIQKASQTGPTCPVCGNVYTFLKKVEAVYSEEKKSWRFRTQNLKVCQCNEKAVYA